MECFETREELEAEGVDMWPKRGFENEVKREQRKGIPILRSKLKGFI